jgi:hypothetical protein
MRRGEEAIAMPMSATTNAKRNANDYIGACFDWVRYSVLFSATTLQFFPLALYEMPVTIVDS